MNQTFLDVKRALLAALHQGEFDHEIHDPKAFYVMTMENGLSGLIFSILNPKKTHQELYQRLQRNHYDYIARDVKQLDAIQILTQILNEHKIDHLFMKGSILKHIYPETYMRAMGDIDILIKSESLEFVHIIFKQANMTCTSRSKQHDVFEMPNGVVLEVHPRLYKPFNDHYTMVEEVWENVHLEEAYRYRMNPEFELIYLLYHLIKHIQAGGIGLRSVLDIGLYVKTYESSMDINILNHMIDQMGIRVFVDSMMDVIERTFEIKTAKFHKQNLDDETYEQLIEYLMISGIHGIGREYNMMTSRAANYKKKNQSKWRLWMDTFFPKMEVMIGIYPWLNKIKILLPVAWMMRWARIMFKRPNQSIKKIKQLNVDDKTVTKRQVLFEKIGL